MSQTEYALAIRGMVVGIIAGSIGCIPAVIAGSIARFAFGQSAAIVVYITVFALWFHLYLDGACERVRRVMGL